MEDVEKAEVYVLNRTPESGHISHFESAGIKYARIKEADLVSNKERGDLTEKQKDILITLRFRFSPSEAEEEVDK